MKVNKVTPKFSVTLQFVESFTLRRNNVDEFLEDANTHMEHQLNINGREGNVLEDTVVQLDEETGEWVDPPKDDPDLYIKGLEFLSFQCMELVGDLQKGRCDVEDIPSEFVDIFKDIISEEGGAE